MNWPSVDHAYWRVTLSLEVLLVATPIALAFCALVTSDEKFGTGFDPGTTAFRSYVYSRCVRSLRATVPGSKTVPSPSWMNPFVKAAVAPIAFGFKRNPPTVGCPPVRFGALASLPRLKMNQSVKLASCVTDCVPLTFDTLRTAPDAAGANIAT